MVKFYREVKRIKNMNNLKKAELEKIAEFLCDYYNLIDNHMYHHYSKELLDKKLKEIDEIRDLVNEQIYDYDEESADFEEGHQ